MNQDPVDSAQVLRAIKKIRTGMDELHRLRVIRSQRWCSDFGEWVVAQLFDGELARSRTNRGHDVVASGQRIQVKTHAKAATNKANRTDLTGALAADALAIVVLSEDFCILAVYKIPSDEIEGLLGISGENGRRCLHWSKLEPWRIPQAVLSRAPLHELCSSKASTS